MDVGVSFVSGGDVRSGTPGIDDAGAGGLAPEGAGSYASSDAEASASHSSQ